MNENQSKSLRSRINNFAKANKVSPQLALQRYFTERFLDRISKSEYAAHLAIKGGTLKPTLMPEPTAACAARPPYRLLQLSP